MTVALEESGLLEQVERLRLKAGRESLSDHKATLGQFLTPATVAQKMADMLECQGESVSILDAGCGVGSLFAACVTQFCWRNCPPSRISVTAYEIDPSLQEQLHRTIQLCQMECEKAGITFEAEVRTCDFIQSAVQSLQSSLFSDVKTERYSCAILNPPYRKIHSQSPHRKWLRQIGIETSNLYTAFLATAMRLLEPHGEMVAITPRSFCNGPYFKPFRHELLQTMALRRLHVYESREAAFRDDKVLQENIIFSAVKETFSPTMVTISTSAGPMDDQERRREVAYQDVVSADDPQSFIHLPSQNGEGIARQIKQLPCTLRELGIEVSTGRVVDFRVREWLRSQPEPRTAALIYPTHLRAGTVTWPIGRTQKPCALVISDGIKSQLIPNENYVLVKRFSTKEETKRIVATVYESGCVPGPEVGFENHLNYFHAQGRGLSLSLARGLAAFLNSTLADAYFRQFNGHTQVNATDLRSFRYPTTQQLTDFGTKISTHHFCQSELDHLIETELLCSRE